MRKLTAALAVLVLALAAGHAAPQKILSQATVDRFLRDVGPIAADLEAYGKSLETDESMGAPAPSADGGFGAPDFKAVFSGLRADAAVRGILAKRGWKEDFWDVYGTIAMGLYVSAMEEVLAQVQMPDLKKGMDEARAMLHPDDLSLVGKNKDRIMTVLEALP